MAGLDNETREMILDTLKKYAERKLTNEFLLALDHNDEFPHQVLQELYDPMQLGLHLLFIPEEYDGLGGGAYDIYRVSELMASIDLGVATGVLATFLGSDPIRVGATEEQKSHWFGRIANESLLNGLWRNRTTGGQRPGSYDQPRCTGDGKRCRHRLQNQRTEAVDQ